MENAYLCTVNIDCKFHHNIIIVIGLVRDPPPD